MMYRFSSPVDPEIDGLPARTPSPGGAAPAARENKPDTLRVTGRLEYVLCDKLVPVVVVFMSMVMAVSDTTTVSVTAPTSRLTWIDVRRLALTTCPGISVMRKPLASALTA